MFGMRRMVVGLLILAAFGLSSCNADIGAGSTPPTSVGISAPAGSTAAGSTAPGSTAPGSTASGSTAAGSTAAPSPTTSGSRHRHGARVSLTGTVEAGVQRGCLLLTDEKTGMRVVLTGGHDSVVRVGARITVVGHIRTDLMSFCQQGPMFQVMLATPR